MDGDNNYQYAPNPVSWIDPLGLTCKENSWNAFQKNTKGHFSSSAEAAKSYRRTQEVQAMKKGTRPDPSTYLPQSYIDAHLEPFSTGGTSRFMTEGNLTKYGPGQRDGTSFVMSNVEADELLARTKGDKKTLENALGLPDGMLDGNKLVRVDTKNPEELNLRMPDGNEAGANEFWLAGGKLPDGSSEAVIDVGGIPSSRYNVTDATD